MQRVNPDRFAGVMAAVLTPFDDDGSVDAATLTLHCRWLLANGCDGLSVFGTTGEGNSLSVDERLDLLEGLIADGIPAQVLLPGTGCCAVTDTARLTERAARLGTAGVLMLPPFYYKTVGDDGIFAALADVVERVGDARMRIYLYHFPQVSAIGFGPALIDRLLSRYPDTFVGMKDSSGDLGGMIATVARFPGFDVFSGADELLLPLLRGGGAGCITGVCNVAAPIAAAVYGAWRRNDQAAALLAHERLTAIRKAFAGFPLAAALKEAIALHTGRSRWRRLRPPLLPLASADAHALVDDLRRIDFTPPSMP